MYADFFGLRELPFNNTPDPRFFYATPEHEEALASLVYAVQQRKGFVLLTGEVGAGKTLVSRLMLRQLGPSISFANVTHAVQSARDLMESICAEFEIAVEPQATLTQLTRALHDFLLTRFARNIPVVLVLDEAQSLPGDAFEQLRMIGNLEADDAKLLQVAIVGEPDLQRRFRTPALRPFQQRLFRSFHLPALDRRVTEGYIRHRLDVAGPPEADVFSADAIDRVFELSRGLPRIINTTCDNAMLSAYSADRRTIDGDFVEQVVRQMSSSGAWSSGTANRVPCVGPVDPAPAGATPPIAAPTGQPGANEPGTIDGTLGGDVLSPGRAHVAELHRRVTQLEGGGRMTPELVADAQRAAAQLAPLVGESRATAERTDAAAGLARREGEKLQALSHTLEAVVRELRRLLLQCQRAGVQLRLQNPDVPAICDRLAVEAARSHRSAPGPAPIAERTIPRNQVAVARRGEAFQRQRARILQDANDRLARVRELAHRSPEETEPSDDPHGAKLARLAEALAGLVNP